MIKKVTIILAICNCCLQMLSDWFSTNFRRFVKNSVRVPFTGFDTFTISVDWDLGAPYVQSDL